MKKIPITIMADIPTDDDTAAMVSESLALVERAHQLSTRDAAIALLAGTVLGELEIVKGSHDKIMDKLRAIIAETSK
jgi:hypothetical protein